MTFVARDLDTINICAIIIILIKLLMLLRRYPTLVRRHCVLHAPSTRVHVLVRVRVCDRILPTVHMRTEQYRSHERC